MKLSKVLKWTLAAVVLLFLVKWVMAAFGGIYHVPPRHMGFGYGGHSMRGAHHAAGFYFIWQFISTALWLAVIALIIGWIIKKGSKRSFNQSMTAGFIPYHNYPLNNHQEDFLDQWESNQMRKKESE